MTEQAEKPSAKEFIASNIYFASLYFIAVGALFLWGYWSSFGINILEYIALSDILKITAYPIATVLLLSIIGGALGEALFGEILPHGGGRRYPLADKLQKILPALAVICGVATLGILIYGPIEKWLVLPFLLGAPIYAWAKDVKFLIRVIPHEGPRSVVIYVLAVLPLLAYGRGAIDADNIMTGKEFTYTLPDPREHRQNIDVLTRLRLIGHAGEHMFFFDPTESAVVIGQMPSDPPLMIKRYKKPTPPPVPVPVPSR